MNSTQGGTNRQNTPLPRQTPGSTRRGLRTSRATQAGSSERGQALVLVILSMTALLGFVGLAADVGVLRNARLALQTVADSAAVAAASEINYGDASSAARTDAAKNGFQDGVGGAALTVNHPPQNGPHTADSNFVEVVASQPRNTLFMGMFNMGTVTIRTRAVAYLGSSTDCIYVLNQTASGAIRANGTSNVQASCGVLDNSNNNSALRANGNLTIAATSIGIVGDYQRNGQVTLSPTPTTGIFPVNDPLAYLVKPTVGACGYNNYSVNGSSTVTLTAGVYCGGITINGSPTVQLSPGTYVLSGGGLKIAGSPTVRGTGVTFFNTGSGGITVNGGNTVQLTAPTTGPYAGILFFQDPANTQAMVLSGNTNTSIQGALYIPKAQLTLNGTGNIAAYTILVADTILLNGSNTLHDDYSSLPGGSPIKATYLVE